MPSIEGVLFCDGCGAEVLGAPVGKDDRVHCCTRCAQGQDCQCALVLDDGRGERFSLALPPLERPGINVVR